VWHINLILPKAGGGTAKRNTDESGSSVLPEAHLATFKMQQLPARFTYLFAEMTVGRTPETLAKRGG
jgi:hypothetical protein